MVRVGDNALVQNSSPTELARARRSQTKMQTDHPPPRTSSPRARMLWLAGVHVLVGLWLGAATALASNESNPNLVFFTFMGLVFSQTSLLGIWGGAGRNRWWIRLIGVLVGIAYLGPQFGICIDQLQREIILIVAFATLIVSAVLLLARCFGLRTRLESDQEPPAREMQFSIRHMMILTLVVACLLALAKWQQRYLDLDDWPMLAAIAAPFATVGLVAAWAVLGAKRPLIGVPVLFAVAVGAAYGLEKSLGPGPGPGFAFWILATLTEALSLTVSLLVVRSCGYRLRRRAKPRPGTDPVAVS
jgi:cytochrome bd-type quinol oxidase subunit 1